MPIGGSALGNGVVFFTEDRWSAAVRDDSGHIVRAQGRLPFSAAGDSPIKRLARMGSSFALLASIKMRLPGARPPFSAKALLGALAIAAAGGRIAADPRLHLTPLQQELLAAASAMLPALALPGRRDALRYHGAEHMTVGAVERHGDVRELDIATVRAESRVHPRCGSSLAWYLLFTTIATNLAVKKVIRRPGRLASVLAGLFSLSAALELFSRSQSGGGGSLGAVARNLGSFTQQRLTTAEPSDQELEVAIVAMRGLLRPAGA